MSKVSILFICHSNICRSPMAEYVLRDLLRKNNLNQDIYVASAATTNEEIGSDIHPGTKRILNQNGIATLPRQARRMTQKDYDQFDYIIGMDHFNKTSLQRFYNHDPQRKISLLMQWAGFEKDVDDPWYTGDFERTYDDILAGCIGLLESIKRDLKIQS